MTTRHQQKCGISQKQAVFQRFSNGTGAMAESMRQTIQSLQTTAQVGQMAEDYVGIIDQPIKSSSKQSRMIEKLTEALHQQNNYRPKTSRQHDIRSSTTGATQNVKQQNHRADMEKPISIDFDLIDSFSPRRHAPQRIYKNVLSRSQVTSPKHQAAQMRLQMGAQARN